MSGWRCVHTVSCLPTTLPGHEEASAAYSFLLNYATPFQEIVLLWIPALVNAVTYGQDFLFLPYCFAMLLVQKYNIRESGWFQIMDSGLGKHHLNAAFITACARLMNEPSVLLWDFPPSSSLIQAYPTAQAHPTAQVCICRRGRCQHTSVCARLPAMLKETTERWLVCIVIGKILMQQIDVNFSSEQSFATHFSFQEKSQQCI